MSYISVFLLVLICCDLFGKSKFVIMIPSYNNERWAEENVLSALNQEYDDFRVIYINDASTDRTLEIVERVKREQDIHGKLTIFSNLKNQGAMANWYNYIHQYVEDEEIVVNLDGDDQLASKQVLAFLDRIYSHPRRKIWLTYGSYGTGLSHTSRHCSKLPWTDQKTRFYRSHPFVSSHLRTFKAWLFKKIDVGDLCYRDKFLDIACDTAMMYPMLEMASNRHFLYIKKVLYIYNTLNPITDDKKRGYQQLIDDYVRSLPEYSPL
ncbi:MAG: glycosyltransferase family 2 protein [Chlamydiia bacterium]